MKRDLQSTYLQIPSDDTPYGRVRQMIEQDRLNLDTMLKDLDANVVDTVIRLLKNASRVFLAGEGNIGHLIAGFAVRFQLLGINAVALPGDLASQAAVLTGLEPGTLMIGVGTSGSMPFTATIVKMARSSGADTIGIVGALTDPIAGVAEHVLVAPAQTIGFLPSYTAHAALLHGLTQIIALDQPDRGTALLLRHRGLLEGYQLALRQNLPHLRKALEAYSVVPPTGFDPQT